MPASSITDLRTEKRIQAFAKAFVQKLDRDALLRRVFPDAAQASTQERTYTFWSNVLHGTQYEGRLFPKPAPLPRELEVFERWQKLLGEALDEHLAGSQANEAKARARNLSVMRQHQQLQLAA